jgi:hypothetical protein
MAMADSVNAATTGAAPATTKDASPTRPWIASGFELEQIRYPYKVTVNCDVQPGTDLRLVRNYQLREAFYFVPEILTDE